MPCKHCHKLFLTKETLSTHIVLLAGISPNTMSLAPNYFVLFALMMTCIHKLLHKAYSLIFVLYIWIYFFRFEYMQYIYIYVDDYIRLLSQQQSLSGGTSLIAMYIRPNGRVSLVNKS